MAEVRALARMEEFAPTEFGTSVLGVVTGAFTHMVLESVFDTALKAKYPEKYPLYSTLLAASAMTATGGGLFIYGKKTTYRLLEYMGAGILLAEVAAWLDMVRISFEIAK